MEELPAVVAMEAEEQTPPAPPPRAGQGCRLGTPLLLRLLDQETPFPYCCLARRITSHLLMQEVHNK